MPRLRGTRNSDEIQGTDRRDRIEARTGDDRALGGDGDDIIEGAAGFDAIYGEEGRDRLFGGTDNDFIFGGRGNDVLFGDDGFSTVKGADLGSDYLVGDRGRDLFVQGDGNDVMSGGAGGDTFLFRWQDPEVAVATASGTNRALTTITDFDPSRDRFQFDALGVGTDTAGANFIDGGAEDGTPGGAAATFFSGDAALANGAAVMVITDRGFGGAQGVTLAVTTEATGDLILFFNGRSDSAELLYVDAADDAHVVLSLTNITELGDLREAGFSADDFIFV